jgi:hypothetical protein
MLAFLLGVERLRILDRAVGGALYVALGACKEQGLEPHVHSDAPENGAADVLEVVFLARDAEGRSAFHELWRVGLADLDAYRVATEVRLSDTMSAARAGLERINAGLEAMDRGEEPEALPEPDPKRTRS